MIQVLPVLIGPPLSRAARSTSAQAAGLLLGCLLATACGTEEPLQWRPPTVERDLIVWEPEVLWQRGGIDDDTVLYGPWSVRGAEDKVIVLDWGGHRVRAFDAEL